MTLRPTPDPYEVLGLSVAADEDTIKKAYRQMARRFHPDTNPEPGAEDRFKEIQAAYALLSDPAKRAELEMARHYERQRVDPYRQAAAPYADGAFAPQPAGMATARFPEQGEHIYAEVSLTFEQTLADSEVALQLSMSVPCARCRGTGVITQVQVLPCPQCGAQGSVRRASEVTVQIPAGMQDGQQLCVDGYGHGGRYGGPPGDLYLTVYVEPSPVFSRDGDNLLVDVPLNVEEAMAGAVIEVPTLDGFKRIRVRPGTQPGSRQRLAEEGGLLPDGSRADLILRFAVQIPAAESDQQRAAARELGDALRLMNPRDGLWNA